jgi:hypothetical protein
MSGCRSSAAGKPGSSQAPFQPRKAAPGVAMVLRHARPQVGGLPALLRALDLAEAGGLHHHMRRDQRDAAHPPVLEGAGMDQRDGGAVRMADQHAAPDARRVQHARQGAMRFLLHVGQRPRQGDAVGLAVAEARIGEDAEAGRRLQRRGEIPPQRDAAEPFMQQQEGGRLVRPRAPPGGFEALPVQGEGRVLHRAASSSARSLKRWILPVAVFGSSSTSAIQRGYFQGPAAAFTCACNSGMRPLS